MREWTIEINEIRQPRERTFLNEPTDPTTTMITYLSEAGSIHLVDQIVQLPANYFQDYYTKHFRFGLNFTSSNEEHGTGISTVGASSPNIVIECGFAQPIDSNVQLHTIVTSSVILDIKANFIDVWRTW